MKQYITYKPEIFPNVSPAQLREFCASYAISGVEEFGDDLVSRTDSIAKAGQYDDIVAGLRARGCQRLHCSYWAYPTAFLSGRRFAELVTRLGGAEAVREYYGDLTGEAMVRRWVEEYRLAGAVGANTYVFHVIDYAPIDGRWDFTLSRETIVGGMITMVQRFLNALLAAGLVSKVSPRIELENAGWGLEYGIQTPSDYVALFAEVYDPYGLLRICWDVNHLLHALVVCDGRVQFAMPPHERDANMTFLAQQAETDAEFDLVQAWIEHCILAPDLLRRLGCVSVSDCVRVDANYFVGGRLRSPEFAELVGLQTVAQQEEYGVRIVLAHYDSHLPVGQGLATVARMREVLAAVGRECPDVVVLHELKNSPQAFADYTYQIGALQAGEL